MVISLNKAIPYLVSTSQGGFQKNKLIYELTRLIQDLIDYVQEEEDEGVIIACDQEKAYDLVNHTFMKKVLDTMGLPMSFIQLVDQKSL